jgi:hypothetical protein
MLWKRTSARRWASLRRRFLAGLSAGAVALALAAAGCGDEGESEGSGEPEAQPVGQDLGGSVASLANCRDWVEGTQAEKLATIEAIRAQLNRGDAAVEAPPLSDEEALDVFNGACRESFASDFRLYVLYARAAGFAPLTREAE